MNLGCRFNSWTPGEFSDNRIPSFSVYIGVSTTQSLSNCRSQHHLWGLCEKLDVGTSSLTKDRQEGEGTEMDKADGSRGK